jgi:hypothetical protein
MKPPRLPASPRGSLLIVAMILCAIIGISLASYLQLSRTAITLSNRNLYNNASMNLAEDGLEEAMYSVNKMVADNTYDWSSDGWKTSGSDAWRNWTGKTLGQNATGEIRVYVYNYNGVSAPKLIARSLITLGGSSGSAIEKWIEVDLAKTSKFSNGLVAKNSILFNGNNPSVDSWNSDPDNNAATAAIGYSSGVRRDNGSVGSISVAVGAVGVANADVWGYVATGADNPTDDVKNNGSIMGANSVYDPSTWTKTNVDPNRISTNFSASFDPVTAPATAAVSLGNLNTSTTLPRVGDTPAADGKYYYTATALSLKSKEFLKISSNKKVVLTLSNTSTSISLAGQSTLQIATNGALEIYAPGDMDLTGGGIANGTDSNDDGKISDSEANQPVNLQIYGTKTSGTQNIKIAGNGVFSGTLYAPQGSVTLTGTSESMGSIVANDITVQGDVAFHYDESLGNLGGNNPFRVAKWKELTLASDRSAFYSKMNKTTDSTAGVF